MLIYKLLLAHEMEELGYRTLFAIVRKERLDYYNGFVKEAEITAANAKVGTETYEEAYYKLKVIRNMLSAKNLIGA